MGLWDVQYNVKKTQWQMAHGLLRFNDRRK